MTKYFLVLEIELQTDFPKDVRPKKQTNKQKKQQTDENSFIDVRIQIWDVVARFTQKCQEALGSVYLLGTLDRVQFSGWTHCR
jgi:hypothetical protein